MTSNEELIRRMYEPVAMGDVDAFAQGLHTDVIWEHNLGGGSPEEGTYRGRDSVVRLFERIIEPWEYLRMEPDHFDRRDDGSLLVKGKIHSKHSTTAAEIVTPFEQRFEVKDDLVVRCRMTFGPLGPAGSTEETAAGAERP